MVNQVGGDAPRFTTELIDKFSIPEMMKISDLEPRNRYTFVDRLDHCREKRAAADEVAAEGGICGHICRSYLWWMPAATLLASLKN